MLQELVAELWGRLLGVAGAARGGGAVQVDQVLGDEAGLFGGQE